MERDPRRNSFNATDHLNYQPIQLKPTDMHTTNQSHDIDSLHGIRKDPSLSNSAILDLAQDHHRAPTSAADVNLSTLANGSFPPHRVSRMLSFVSAPKFHLMPSGSGASVRTAKQSQEDTPYAMVIYTNVSVSPDYEPPQVEAAARTLHSMGFAPPATPSIRETGTAHTGVGAVLSAMGAMGSQISAAQHLTVPSLPPNSLTVAHVSSTPVCSRPIDQFNLPISSSMPPVLPSRYPLIPPTYQGSLDPSAFRDAGFRYGGLAHGALRQELPPHVLARSHGEKRDAQTNVQNRQQEEQHHQLQQQLHMQQMRQMHQYQGNQPLQQFSMEHQGRPQLQQQFNFTQREANRPQHSVMANVRQVSSNEGNIFEKEAKEGPDPIEKRAMNRQVHSASRIVYKAGSVPATPTTAATSSTVPFPTTPSSPDNNGSSSNGSGQREHACQHPGCTKSFDRRYNLTVHFRRHTNDMPYPCKVEGCPQRFKWRSSQSHHLKTRHQMTSTGKAGRVSMGKSPNRTLASKHGAQQLSNGSNHELRYPRSLSESEGFGKTMAGQATHGDRERMNDGSQQLEDGSFSPNKKARLQTRKM